MQSNKYCAALRQNLWPNSFFTFILHLAKKDLSVSIRYLRLNISLTRQKNNLSTGLRFLKNNFYKAVERQFCFCVTSITLSTQVWFMSVLLVLSLNVTNWSNSETEISILITFTFLINRAACLAAVNMILLMQIKLFNAILNSVSIFSFSPSISFRKNLALHVNLKTYGIHSRSFFWPLSYNWLRV